MLYVGFADAVVAITAPGIPRMPNGIMLETTWGLPRIGPGAHATLYSKGLAFGDQALTWNETYDLVIKAPRREYIAAVALPPLADPVLAAGLQGLVAGLVEGRRAHVADAVASLLGRGRGLTPEGDDLIAAASATARALGCGPDSLRACVPRDIRSHTTSLSATLLELAVEGRVVEPLLRVLSEGHDLDVAITDLNGLGSTTGTCYLRAVGAMMDAYRRASPGKRDPALLERK